MAVTIRGRVRSGVEGGCLVLDSDRGSFTLVGSGDTGPEDPGPGDTGPPDSGGRTLVPGAQVEVTGRIDDSGMSVCQEGRILYVLSARRG